MGFLHFLTENQISKEDYFKTVVYDNIKNQNSIPTELVECDCCKRHKLNFPKKLEHWVETPETSRARECCGGPGDMCACPCRHIARFMCRQISKMEFCSWCGSNRMIDKYSKTCDKCNQLVCEYCYTICDDKVFCDSCIPHEDTDGVSIGSTDSTRSEDSEESENSLDSFIVEDSGMSNKERRMLNKIKRKLC